MNLITNGAKAVLMLFAISCDQAEGSGRTNAIKGGSDAYKITVRRLGTGKSKKSKVSGKSGDISTATPVPVGSLAGVEGSNDSTFLSDICDLFLDFDDIGDGFCSDFDHPQQHLLCPSDYGTEKICQHGDSDLLDDSVFMEYCEPLFAPLDDAEQKEACTKSCMEYVSPNKLDCCNVSCP